MPDKLLALLRTMGTRASFVRLILVTAGIFCWFCVVNPSVFLSGANVMYIMLSSPELAILSLAIALAMLTGGIDLSVVAIANLAGIVAARVMIDAGGPGGIALGAAAGLGVALLCGLGNGLLVGGLGIPPILVTLGTSQLIAGIGLVACNGTVIKGLPEEFTGAAELTVAGIPLLFWIMLAIAALVAVLVAATPLGVRMRLVGANPHAADYSGIRRLRVLVLTYLITSGLAGIAGLLISARASGANSQYGGSYVLLGIVIAVLAGVNPDGGYMTTFGVIIAVLALQMLSTGLLSLGYTAHMVNIAQGLLLIIMVLLSTWHAPVRDRLRRRGGKVAA